jgi:hypothetical protein
VIALFLEHQADVLSKNKKKTLFHDALVNVIPFNPIGNVWPSLHHFSRNSQSSAEYELIHYTEFLQNGTVNVESAD